MQTMTIKEMHNTNGGYYFHCRVCHAYKGGWGFTTTSRFFAGLHMLSSGHRKAVKAIGYGHGCC